ncbi:MAG: hypothetical protein J6S69_00005 [Proteobacteria bacterium]|nr:hypothetical protein [Pseudomonadota bacterium]
MSDNKKPRHQTAKDSQELGFAPPKRRAALDSSRHNAKAGKRSDHKQGQQGNRQAQSRSEQPGTTIKTASDSAQARAPWHVEPKTKRGHEKDVRQGTSNPRELVVETLMRIDEGGFSNIVWDVAMRRSALNELDKVLATRIFYGTLSNMRLIDALWSDIEPEMLRRADSVVKMTLRSAMYQLVFLDRVPAYSIVSTSVDVVKRLRNKAASGYCNALLRKAVARHESPEGLKFKPTGDTLTDFAIRYSLNDDLARLLQREFGPQAEAIAESMLSVPKMILRVNESKTSMADILALQGVSVTPTPLLPESSCAVISRHDSIDEALERGEVCVQDEAAQLAVRALNRPASWMPDKEEIHIWDACAGLGGKTIHMLDEIACDKTGRKYAILSTDLYANKLERLRDYHQKHFSKLPLVTKVRDLTVGGSVPLAPFDVILVDAPCSGLGVLRRHPEVKLTRTTEAIDSLVILQREILDNVCRHLSVGGVLVYAVCTITREECEDQVEAFLQRHPNYEADILPPECLGGHAPASQIKFLPHVDGCDGFFVARFRRVSKS